MPATYYPAIIDRSKSGFGVTFPDFPGCIAAGATINEAALAAEGALALHVESMAKDKDPLPDPSSLDAIEPIEGADDVARLLIRVEAPARVERVLVSLDANLLHAIDASAPNRSAWIADAARLLLAAKSNDVACGILGQGELATKMMDDVFVSIEERYGLKPKRVRPEKPSKPHPSFTPKADAVRRLKVAKHSDEVVELKALGKL